MRRSTPEAYQLLHDGSIALAQVEANGMRVDVPYLKKTLKKVSRKIARNERNLQSSDVWKTWRKVFRGKANLGSREQLGEVLFDHMGFECHERTKTGRAKTDGTALERVKIPFVKDYLETESLKKLRSTYLKGILRETVDGICHPSFNLHLVKTFRSSSDSPNFQNLPIRDPEQGKLIRNCFIPRPGGRIVEIDYSGIEVSIAACYHKDPVMLTYIKDKTKDMHRDMAMQCFKLSLEELGPTGKGYPGKNVRYAGKNMFVFPQFYGSWYPDCAKNLWEACETMKLTTVDGVPLQDHLATKGIKKRGACNKRDKPTPGTFEKWIQMVEKDFWSERFKRYDKWKKEWWDSYLEKGGFLTKTGFWIEGLMSRNDCINWPVQGSAFHCLLWSVIRLLREIEKRGMKTKLVGQIHDSIVADVPDNELKQYLRLARRVMTQDILREWKWIIVPLEIEAEITPVDGSWFTKKEIKIG